jgi:hypothetical protein
MNGDRLDHCPGKFQHQGGRLRAGGEHFVGNTKLIKARQQLTVHLNPASGPMFAQLSIAESYPPNLGFAFANVSGTGIRRLCLQPSLTRAGVRHIEGVNQ